MGASTLGNRQSAPALDARASVPPLTERPAAPTLGNRRLVARAGLALVLANARYWSTVAPVVRRELRHWEQRAQAIDDLELRALALEKLRGEGFHAQAAAMLATLAPRRHRRDVVQAIVALELLYDCLDGLTERPSEDPLGDVARLFAAYTQAIAAPEHPERDLPAAPDVGYPAELSHTVSSALRRLPRAAAVTAVASANAAFAAETQVRMHAVPQLGIEQLRAWGIQAAAAVELPWRELLTGAASSVLALHALIAAAADPRTTPAEAQEIASAYLSTCVLLTLLDGLVDHEQDTRANAPASEPGQLGYIDLYDRDELSRVLTDATRRAAMQARMLRNGPHHAMTLVGVVAYYTSAPGARGEPAAPIARRLQHQLKPLIYPTLVLMRGWRLTKRIGNQRSSRTGGPT
jgi:tetraprenyl-beta-curcumene synthase